MRASVSRRHCSQRVRDRAKSLLCFSSAKSTANISLDISKLVHIQLPSRLHSNSQFVRHSAVRRRLLRCRSPVSLRCHAMAAARKAGNRARPLALLIASRTNYGFELNDEVALDNAWFVDSG